MISLYSRGPNEAYWHTSFCVILYPKPYGDTILPYVGLHVLDRDECELAYDNSLIVRYTPIVIIFVSLITTIIIVTLACFTWYS